MKRRIAQVLIVTIVTGLLVVLSGCDGAGKGGSLPTGNNGPTGPSGGSNGPGGGRPGGGGGPAGANAPRH